MSAVRFLPLGVVLGGMISGCAGSSFMSGGSAMQIEVDVYKGPLSRTLVAQYSDALGAMEGTRDALLNYMRDTLDVVPDGGVGENDFTATCKGSAADAAIKSSLCADALRAANDLRKVIMGWVEKQRDLETAENAVRQSDVSPSSRASFLSNDVVELLASNSKNQSLVAVVKAGQSAKVQLDIKADDSLSVARTLEERAWYWSTHIVLKDDGGTVAAGSSANRLITRFVQIAADAANVITSRVDSLDKSGNGAKASYQASTADYLRDVAPTAYLDLRSLFAEDRGAARSKSPMSPEERVKIARNLFDDRYWTNINKVYASGQGDVRMAFIRDEIGNWNLKSFDSDPEKLLEQYRKLTFAGIGFVTKAIKAGTTGQPGLLDMVGGVARGQLGESQQIAQFGNGIKIAGDQAGSSLKKLNSDLDGQKTALNEAVSKAEMDLPAKKKAHQDAGEGVAELEKSVTAAIQNLRTAESSTDDDGEERRTKARDVYQKALDDLRQARERHDVAARDLAEAGGMLQDAKGKRLAAVQKALASAKDAIDAYRRNVDIAEAVALPP